MNYNLDTSAMTDEEALIANQFANVFKRRDDALTGEFDKKLLGINSEIAKLKQMGVRLPMGGNGMLTQGSDPALMLTREAKFRDWIKSPKNKLSSHVVSMPFDLTKKAAILGAGLATPIAGISGPPQPSLRLTELMMPIPMSSGSSAEITQEASFVPGAAVVPEGTQKPTTTLTFTNVNVPIATIATITKASLQSIADLPGLSEWIDARLSYAVQLSAEGVFLPPLLAAAGALSVDYTPPAGASGLDVIAAAISQLTAMGYQPDGIVLNGSDAAGLRLLKDDNSNYLWASPSDALGTSAMWSVRVIISPAQAKSTWLVGAFRQSTVLLVRQQLTVDIAFENANDFELNLCTIRAEERGAAAVMLPQGLVKGTFNVAVP